MKIGKLNWAEMEPKKKKQVMAIGAMIPLFLIFMGVGIVRNLGSDPPPKTKIPTAEQPALTDDALQPTVAVNTDTNPKRGIGGLRDYMLQNPFVEMAQLVKNNVPPVPSGTVVAPPIVAPVTQRPVAPSSVPLPAIPSAPVPAAGGNAPQVPASNQVTVQGILTGDDGENMAILSNGQVVSEGDTVQGDKIAYIGGGGIQFDNGRSLDYK